MKSKLIKVVLFKRYFNPQYLALLHYDHARVLVSSLLCLLLTVDAFKLGLETAAPQSLYCHRGNCVPFTLSTQPYRVRLRALLYLCERGLEGSDQFVGAAVVVVVTIHLENKSRGQWRCSANCPIFIKPKEMSSNTHTHT